MMLILQLLKLMQKNPYIYNPSDWYQIIQNSKRKNPFRVLEMNPQDFLSTLPLEEAVTNRKKNNKWTGSQLA